MSLLRAAAFVFAVVLLSCELGPAFNNFQQEQSRQLTLRIQEDEMLTVDFGSHRKHELSADLWRFEPD
jgi:hypothetical protein